jgi:hypothetical protein
MIRRLHCRPFTAPSVQIESRFGELGVSTQTAAEVFHNWHVEMFVGSNFVFIVTIQSHQKKLSFDHHGF